MRLAVLMTNTDESDFAQDHPKDDEKFAALIHMVRPAWLLETFAVKDDVFPDDPNTFDGVVITGSPASVHDKDPWTAQLIELINGLNSAGIPMFGACYGHQAIALALGGTVGPNPSGWVFGLTHSTVVEAADWMQDLPQTFSQYGAHIEAVTKLPLGAKVLSTSADCAITGFRMGHTIYTTQNHPEMSAEFIAALVAEYDTKLPAEVVKLAKASLSEGADTMAYAETIARFFEGNSPD